jgi:hypothetical protein
VNMMSMSMNMNMNMIKKAIGYLFPVSPVYAHGEPGTADIKYNFIDADKYFASTPSGTEVPLLGCPKGAGEQLEFVSLDFFAHTVPADSNGTILMDIEHTDDSNSDTIVNVPGGAAVDLEGHTARVISNLWRGGVILDEGDTIIGEMATDGAISTPSVGACFIVGYKVKRRMAA